jgi:hypothetical protein
VRALLALALVISGASAPTRATEVIRWSPFTSAGAVKPGLAVEFVKHGRCTDIGYTLVGGVAYRCGAGNGLYDACWRDGPKPTEFVICLGSPWDTKVTRMRSPHLLLYPGVTFDPPASYPWSIELTDGTRCTVEQGAHAALTASGRRWIVDYGCTQRNLVLLREGLRRGRVWYVNAARLISLRRGFLFLGERAIRRVYFGTLPPPMLRQHRLAHEAVVAAKRILRPATHGARLSDELAVVRLALPRADWARVIFGSVSSDRSWSVVLHRVSGRWREASAFKPYCTKLPARVRSQLFFSRGVRLPGYLDQPTREQRC